jgi:scyllo-inositol 2-dehydrogenase (NADP+)
MSPIQVGLIGYGMAGRVFHAPSITAVPELHLGKVVERRTADSRTRYPWVEVVADASAVLDDPAIELVVIATPNESHFPLAEAALRAGKHVVVDKPFTTTTAEAETLVALALAHQRVLSVYHNRRWDGDFLTVQQVVRGGHLGRIVEFESRFDRFRPALRPNAWREAAVPGSGILFDLGPHLLDQAVQLFGLPEGLTADVRIQRTGGLVDDSFLLLLYYPDGLRVTLRAGMVVREPSPRFVVHGTAGSFVKMGLDPQEEGLKNGRSPLEPNWGVEPEANWGTLNRVADGLAVRGKLETLPGSYLDYYRGVAAAVRGGGQPPVTAEQAADVMRLLAMAQASHALGRRLAWGAPND